MTIDNSFPITADLSFRVGASSLWAALDLARASLPAGVTVLELTISEARPGSIYSFAFVLAIPEATEIDWTLVMRNSIDQRIPLEVHFDCTADFFVTHYRPEAVAERTIGVTVTRQTVDEWRASSAVDQIDLMDLATLCDIHKLGRICFALSRAEAF